MMITVTLLSQSDIDHDDMGVYHVAVSRGSDFLSQYMLDMYNLFDLSLFSR